MYIELLNEQVILMITSPSCHRARCNTVMCIGGQIGKRPPEHRSEDQTIYVTVLQQVRFPGVPRQTIHILVMFTGCRLMSCIQILNSIYGLWSCPIAKSGRTSPWYLAGTEAFPSKQWPELHVESECFMDVLAAVTTDRVTSSKYRWVAVWRDVAGLF